METSGRVGANLGGFAWMLLLGIATGNWILIAGPVLLAFVGIRWFRKPGHVTLWVVGWSALAMNVYYDQIPERFLGISTGKDMMSLPLVNIVFGALVVLVIWFIARAES